MRYPRYVVAVTITVLSTITTFCIYMMLLHSYPRVIAFHESRYDQHCTGVLRVMSKQVRESIQYGSEAGFEVLGKGQSCGVILGGSRRNDRLFLSGERIRDHKILADLEGKVFRFRRYHFDCFLGPCSISDSYLDPVP